MNPTVSDLAPTEGNGKSQQSIIFRIRRQDGPDKPVRWEEFSVPQELDTWCAVVL